MKLGDLINRPRTVLGALTAAAVMTTLFVGVIAVAMRLIESRWVFSEGHALIWILALFGCNALFTAIALVQKAREDNRKAPQARDAPRRFAGPGHT